MSPRRLLALLLCASAALAAVPSGALPATFAPHDSPRAYSAGWAELNYTDGYGIVINATVFYPAMSAAQDATPSKGGAPYPAVVLVPDGPGAVDKVACYGSYARYLSERGYLVSIIDLAPHDAWTWMGHARMANSTLSAVGHLGDENTTTGSRLEGMVDGALVALVGHGQGARVALLAALRDSSRLVHSVACLSLVDGATGGAGAVAPMVGALPLPLHIQGGQNVTVPLQTSWEKAFGAKARGFVSFHIIAGGNHTLYLDVNWSAATAAPDWPAGINRTRQQQLSLRYLLAFLDFHLKDDAVAGNRLYGTEARLDLDDGILVDWRYGVLDESLAFSRPAQSATVPTGYTDFCATVVSLSPFPMALRNVTLEVARVEGIALVTVYGPANRSVGPMGPGASGVASWEVLITTYGEYRAFASMDDPDHNGTNNVDVLDFTVSPLPPPRIDHTPADSIELGTDYYVLADVHAESGLSRVWLNSTDVDGLVSEEDMVDIGSGVYQGVVPAQRSVGIVGYSVLVLAGNGVRNATMRFYVPVIDTTPPSLSHLMPGEPLRVRQELDVCATVTDADEVARVKLMYTDPGAGVRNVSCGRDDDRWFYPLVLGPTAGELTYLWWAQDAWGNTATLGPFSLEVRDMGPPTIVPEELGALELLSTPHLAATVSDDALVTSVWVLYTVPGTGQPTNATPLLQGGLYRLTLPQMLALGDLVYEWGAIDVNGMVASTGAVEVPVVDSVDPAISEVESGDAFVGQAPWIKARVVDPGGLSSVVLEYVGSDGSPGAVAMSDAGNGTYGCYLPVQTRGGEVRFTIRAEDLSGNSADSSERTMVVRDTEPPKLTHAPPAPPVQGTPLRLRVNVTDNAGVARVHLELKLNPMSVFQRIEMQEVEPGIWEHVVAGEDVNPTEVLYYFEAQDLMPSANVGRLPADAPLSLYRLNITARVLTIYGIVKDRAGEPLKGASVVVIGTSLEATTDPEGKYLIEGLAGGTHTVWVSRAGFRDVRVDVVVSVEEPSRKQDFTLLREPETDGYDVAGTDLFYFAVGFVLIALAIAILAWRLASARRRRPGRSDGRR